MSKNPKGTARKEKVDPKAEKERVEREAEEKRKALQEELRKKVIEEQMENDPIIKYVEELKTNAENVGNALEHPLVFGEPSEWSNIPKLVARFSIHTQAHLHAVVRYLAARDGFESVESLRSYTQIQIDKQQKQFEEKTGTDDRNIQRLFVLDEEINTKATRIDKDLNEFKIYSDKFKEATVAELFDVSDPKVLKNDNDGHKYGQNDVLEFGKDTKEYLESVESARAEAEGESAFFATVPNEGENELTKARLVTFKQLYDFNNMVLNKSYLRKRTAKTEDHVSKLQKEMIEVQEWRKDIETRMKDQFKEVDDHFEQDDEEFAQYQKKVAKQFENKQNQLINHDALISNIQATLEENKKDREDLHGRCDVQEQRTTLLNDNMEKKLAERFTKLLDKQNYAEKEINQSIALLSKELEKLKYELSDVIDNKFEHIQRQLEQETKVLKQTYDELSTSLSATSKELNGSFKEKVHHLQAMCATFFAKIEVSITTNNAKVEKMETEHDNFTANFVNPAKEVDAKIFAMTQNIQSSERMREAQFALVKDTIQKVIFSMDTANQGNYVSAKSTLSIILASNSMAANAAQYGGPTREDPSIELTSPQGPSHVNINMNSLGSDQSNDGKDLGKQTHREDLRLPDILDKNKSAHPSNISKKKTEQRTLQNSRSDPLLRGTKRNTEFNTSQNSHNNDLLEDTNVGPIGPQSNMNFEINKDITKKNSKASLSHIPSQTRMFSNQGTAQSQLNRAYTLKNLGGPIAELDERMRKDLDLLQKRFYFIRKQLEDEVIPVPPPSRDHTRANRNGIKLDLIHPGGDLAGMTVDAQGGFKQSGLQYKNPFNRDRRSVDNRQFVQPGTADDTHTPRIKSKKGSAIGSGNKFEQYVSSPISGRSHHKKDHFSRGGNGSKESMLKADLAKMINDKTMIYKNRDLPSALGQSLTPSHIKIQSSNQSRIRVIENDKIPSIQSKPRYDSRMSQQHQNQLFRGSPQNPENIGLQTSPVKIVQLGAAKNKALKKTLGNLESAENNLRKQLEHYKKNSFRGQTSKNMNDTLNGTKNAGTGVPSVAGNTMRLGVHGQHSDTTSMAGGIGYTPSVMSPIKYGTGIGLNLGGPDTTLYSVPSPRMHAIHAIHDPVREVDENIREKGEILQRQLIETRKKYKGVQDTLPQRR